MGEVPREKMLLDTLVELADTLVAGYDIVELLHTLVTECVRTLGAADAGIMVPDENGSLSVIASSSERIHLVGLLQLDARQGPCLDAYRTGRPVSVNNLAKMRDLWPEFVGRAGELGYQWVYAVPLRLRDDTIGSLNLFGDRTDGLSPEDVNAARGLADIASIGILHERAFREADVARTQLQYALESRVVVEQAKGVIAKAHKINMDEAFGHLRDTARSTQRRLSDIAREVIGDAEK
ncbi:GAF domain-containing protein [Microbacterium sp. P01]|uniref:GAF domain-containing protein n=1 Tax=Microbacterium sp. P01 TaxID=3366261 RepID=UPI00366FC987